MTDSEIQYFVQKRRESIANSEIRKEIETQGYSKSEVFYWVNKIDDEFLLSVTNKRDLAINNFTLRALELTFGIVMLIIGLVLLTICVVYGPAILTLLIGGASTSSGYYFTQKAVSGFAEIRQAAKKEKASNKLMSTEIIDD